MPLFSRGPKPEPDAIALELSAKLSTMSASLDRLAVALQAHCDTTALHGAKLDGMPNLVVQAAVKEARASAQLALHASFVAVRRHVAEELAKWLWRAGLTYAGARALLYLHALAGAFTLGGGGKP